MAKVNYVRYSITFAFFAFINFEVSTSNGYGNFACTQDGPCRCKKLSGDLIDLSPLENFTGPEPGFLTAQNKQGVYFYHPCSDLPLHFPNVTECSSGCSLCFFQAQTPSSAPLDAKAVLAGNIPGSFHKLANAGQAVFQPSESEIHLVFKPSNVTVIIINLECDESNNEKSVLSFKDANAAINLTNHNLVLHSPYSCFRTLSHDKHYMSGFGVFCIILITIAAAYFFGGMLVLRHIKGATGTEMIPNYDFWVSVPNRVKRGCLRLVGKESQAGNTYESI